MIWEPSGIRLKTLVSLNPVRYEFSTVYFYNAEEASKAYYDRKRLRAHYRGSHSHSHYTRHDFDYDHEFVGGSASDFYGLDYYG